MEKGGGTFLVGEMGGERLFGQNKHVPWRGRRCSRGPWRCTINDKSKRQYYVKYKKGTRLGGGSIYGRPSSRFGVLSCSSYPPRSLGHATFSFQQGSNSSCSLLTCKWRRATWCWRGKRARRDPSGAHCEQPQGRSRGQQQRQRSWPPSCVCFA